MIRKLVLSIALILPILIVFRFIFLPGPLVWGDAPFFYSEGLKELVNEPLAWISRGYSFGGINLVLWLSPIMLLYGLLHLISGLGNDLIIRILFYFPSVILAGVGTYLFTRYLRFSKIVQFFSVLTYLLNTYYLLLIDGGQVGIALSYGLFPLSLLFLKKLVDVPSFKNFYLGLFFLVLCGIADPRIAVISVGVIVVWQILDFKFKSLFYLIPLIFCWILINFYWIYPLFKNGSPGQPFFPSQLKITSWFDPFILRAPHWPANLFGKVAHPPFYFAVVPLLIFGGLFFRRERKTISLGFIFLVFAILYSYNFIVNLPYGSAFRDSTKFFIPLVLFGGVLIGNTIETISQKLKVPSYILYPISYIYLLLLISPALLGKMNFNLSNRQQNSDLQKIYENLKSDNSFYAGGASFAYRTVWFPEKHPLTFETTDRPAIDARDLATFWPFAYMNAGEDVFNFLNNEDLVETFRVLGIKYLVMSDNPREISKNEKDKKDWDTIQGLVSSNQGLEKMDWSTKIPVYKLKDDVYPQFYAVKKLVGVIGSQLQATSYQLPTVYFEDGRLNFTDLEGLDANSVSLVFNKREKSDLAMSFLQKFFIGPSEASKKQWAVYTKDQYLKYKYELLIRGIKFNDFDFGKGIAFSTKKGEKIEFEFEVPENGDYLLIYRSMIPSQHQTQMRWSSTPLKLSKGKYAHVFENNYDLEILNTVGLVPKNDYEKALVKADVFIKHFGETDIKNLKSELGYQEVNMEKWGTLKYKFIPPEGYRWIIFTDRFNSLWKLRRGEEYHNSVPVFSMVNGFYVGDKWRDLRIEFKGQENVRWGMYWSAISLILMGVIYLWVKIKNNERNEG